jgi:hypothetical protein
LNEAQIQETSIDYQTKWDQKTFFGCRTPPQSPARKRLRIIRRRIRRKGRHPPTLWRTAAHQRPIPARSPSCESSPSRIEGSAAGGGVSRVEWVRRSGELHRTLFLKDVSLRALQSPAIFLVFIAPGPSAHPARSTIRDAVNARSRTRQLLRKPTRPIPERPHPGSRQSGCRSLPPYPGPLRTERSPGRSWSR